MGAQRRDTDSKAGTQGRKRHMNLSEVLQAATEHGFSNAADDDAETPEATIDDGLGDLILRREVACGAVVQAALILMVMSRQSPGPIQVACPATRIKQSVPLTVGEDYDTEIDEAQAKKSKSRNRPAPQQSTSSKKPRQKRARRDSNESSLSSSSSKKAKSRSVASISSNDWCNTIRITPLEDLPHFHPSKERFMGPPLAALDKKAYKCYKPKSWTKLSVDKNHPLLSVDQQRFIKSTKGLNETRYIEIKTKMFCVLSVANS